MTSLNMKKTYQLVYHGNVWTIYVSILFSPPQTMTSLHMMTINQFVYHGNVWTIYC